MAKRLQGLIIGILIGTLMAGSVAYAANQSLEAYYNNIKIVVDGKEITPKDANGKTVEPFIVNGTTYLPVRAVAGALGKEVYWDGPNFTVYLGNMNGQLEYPSLKLGDAVNIGNKLSEAKTPIDNYGNTYGVAYYIGYRATTYQTLLNMKYSHFKGTFFVPQGTTENSATSFRIEVDGKVVFSSGEITKTSEPIYVDINIAGGDDFKIIISGVSMFTPTIYFGDCGFYQ